MGLNCSICAHKQRKEIERLLLEPKPNFSAIARKFNADRGALKRHIPHIVQKLTKAKEIKEVAQADSLLGQVKSLSARALSILSQAEGAGDLRTACAAIREVRGTMELLAKISGELNERPQINILMSPEWVTVRTVILQTLEPYPEARVQLVDALAKVEVQQP